MSGNETSDLTAGVAKNFSIALDLKETTDQPSIEVVEGDSENYIAVSLYDDGTAVDLTDYRIIVALSHSNGVSILDSSTSSEVDVDNNVVTIHIGTDSVSPGIVECELQIFTRVTSYRTTTAKFNFNCRAAIATNEVITHSENYSALNNLIIGTNSLLQNAADVLSQSQTAMIDLNNLTSQFDSLDKLHIRYSATNPATDNNAIMTATPSTYIGISTSNSITAPTSINDYTWHRTDANSVSSALIDNSNNLKLTLSDGQIINAGSLEPLVNGINQSIVSINTAMSTNTASIAQLQSDVAELTATVSALTSNS